MDQDSMESDGSDSEDDFVVVIPDCFNLNVPLPTQHMTQSCEDLEITPNTHSTPPTTSNDVMTKSCDSIPAPAPSAPVFISFQPSPVPVPHTQPENQTPPEPTNEPKTTGASPRSGRRSFVPERVTLREVKDARLRNPLTVATGLLNTVSDLVEGLNLSGKRRGGGADRDGRKPESTVAEGEENQEGETFVVSGSHSHSLSLTHSLTHSLLSLTLTCTHTHTHTHSLSLSLSHTHTLTFSLTYTHTLTLL